MLTPSCELVLVPSPLTGHLLSMVELARILAARNHRLSITILIINIQFDSNAAAHIRSLAAAAGQKNICFTILGEEGDDVRETAGPNPTTSVPAWIEHHKPRVRDFVAKHAAQSDSVPLGGLVLDMFCMPLVDVANEFGVPWYLYFTSGASVLSFACHVQALHDDFNQELTQFKDSDTELDIPGFANPVPARVFPSSALTEAGAASFLQRARRYRQAKGILVNTFWELESPALSKYGDAIRPIPPVYTVGPVLNLRGDGDDVGPGGGGDRTAEIVRWLDGQPKASVVFLCFGSMGSFPAEQVKEIARGLEKSGQRFLWSLRRPKDQDNDKFQLPGEYEDPEEVLPEGFLKRTAEKGKVIGWAPQVAVLSHGAVGGFVSHCGWNSVLESVWFGVPIATWPMYAEQQMNAFVLTRELGLAVEITLDYRKDGDGVNVSGDDVERGIRVLMEGRDGDDSGAAARLREKAEAARQESRRAVIEGGSSYAWIQRFADDVVNNVT